MRSRNGLANSVSSHIPVLLKEALAALDPKPGESFIDATYGGGGHSRAILEKITPPTGGKKGKLLALDWNETAAIRCRTDYCVVENFANLPEVMRKFNIKPVDGLLLDLGVSTDELEHSRRGFSFQRDESLLMTYNDQKLPVRDLLKQLNEKELADTIWRYGEERNSRKIAKAIKLRLRKSAIRTTKELVETIELVLPRKGKLHPATKTFMALRIYANDELTNLEEVLKNLDKIMAPAGRTAVISFHSLEDRLVKNYFKRWAAAGQAELINKKPITAGAEEILKNPRSRSAKLRTIRFLNPKP